MFHRATVVAGLTALLSAASVHAETVVLAADEWCPYNCSPNDPRPGYMIEIARKALESAGHQVKYVVMPWSRALAETRAGRIDGAVGATEAEYPSAVYPSVPLGLSGNALAMRPERAAGFRFEGVASLKTLKIGGAQNYSYDEGPIDEYFASAAASGMVELLSGSEIQSQNLRKLLAGRVDAVIDDGNVLRLAITEMQPRPEIVLVPVDEPGPLSIAFSEAKPSSRQYADLITRTLAEMRKSGALAELLAHYNLRDWAP